MLLPVPVCVCTMSGPSTMPLCQLVWLAVRRFLGVVLVIGTKSEVRGTDQMDVAPRPMWLLSLFQINHELPLDGSVKTSGSMLPP